MSNSADKIRTEITQKIVDSMSAGTLPWRQPWKNNPNAGTPANFQTKRRYSGINTLILLNSSMTFGYHSRYWGSYASIAGQIGASVKKGEKSTFINFFKMLPIKKDNGAIEKDKNGNEKCIPLLRQYPLFNVEQCEAPSVETLLDGRGAFSFVKTLLGQTDKKNRKDVTTIVELRQIAAKYLPVKEQPNGDVSREKIAEMIHQSIATKLASFRADVMAECSEPDYGPAECVIKGSQAVINHGGNRAFYNQSTDKIQLPMKASFTTLAQYYQVAFHELAHWTQPENRVGRTVKFENPNEAYAFEELIAELSACFTLTELGVPVGESMLPQSQSYLANWLKAMNNDSKYIFAAATQASKVVDYLLKIVGMENPSYEEDDTNNVMQKVA